VTIKFRNSQSIKTPEQKRAQQAQDERAQAAKKLREGVDGAVDALVGTLRYRASKGIPLYTAPLSEFFSEDSPLRGRSSGEVEQAVTTAFEARTRGQWNVQSVHLHERDGNGPYLTATVVPAGQGVQRAFLEHRQKATRNKALNNVVNAALQSIDRQLHSDTSAGGALNLGDVWRETPGGRLEAMTTTVMDKGVPQSRAFSLVDVDLSLDKVMEELIQRAPASLGIVITGWKEEKSAENSVSLLASFRPVDKA
jgi:hypothetical protein